MVNIDGLVITGGATSDLDSGGGIFSFESLNLANVNVFGNSAGYAGGGILSSLAQRKLQTLPYQTTR